MLKTNASSTATPVNIPKYRVQEISVKAKDMKLIRVVREVRKHI